MPTAIPQKSRWRAVCQTLLVLLLSLAAAGVAVSAFGTQTYHWQAFDVQVSVQPALKGRTRLIFTPLGEVQAATHTTPLALKVGLRNISVERLKTLVAKPPPRAEIERDFERSARRILTDFGIRQVALAALGALFIPVLLRVRHPYLWLLSMVAGGAFAGAMLFFTALSFDPRAFASPTYTGSLREAGSIISLAREAFNNARAFSDKLRLVATNLNTLYGRISTLPGLVEDRDTVRILHISDIHNNPAALDFVRELAARFEVGAIVDTGDLTDYGTPVESRLSTELARLNIPYLFVAGNHDSRATVAAVRAGAGGRILDGTPVEAAGLTFLGAPDPSSLRPGLGDVNTPEEDLRATGERLLATYQIAPTPPDIVCVHNPRMGGPLRGTAQVILAGHMHQVEVEVKDGTVVCNAGTTGGAGVRYFDRQEGVPFSAAILTFSRPPAPRLLSIDVVVLDGALNQYSLTRHTFSEAAPSAPPPAAAPPPGTGSPPVAPGAGG